VYFPCCSRFRRKLFNLVTIICSKFRSSWTFHTFHLAINSTINLFVYCTCGPRFMREFFNLVNFICSKFRSSLTCLTVFSSSTVPSTSLSTSLADRGSGESSSTWSTLSATKSDPHECL
jgi:hypothetical protein